MLRLANFVGEAIRNSIDREIGDQRWFLTVSSLIDQLLSYFSVLESACKQMHNLPLAHERFEKFRMFKNRIFITASSLWNILRLEMSLRIGRNGCAPAGATPLLLERASLPTTRAPKRSAFG